MDRPNRHMLADRPPLTFRRTDTPDGFVETAVCRNGAILLRTFLPDRAGGRLDGPAWRCVCLPAAVAREVIAELAAELDGLHERLK